MITVLLAEDMHMMRGAIVALLDLEPDIEVVAQVSSGDDILPAATEFRPDVAVLDIDLPGTDGLTAAVEVHRRLPEVRTLMLTGLTRPFTLQRALDAKVGGFVLKDAPSEELAHAIREVAAGRRHVDGKLVLSAYEAAQCPLTSRELEVLRLAATGRRPAEISAELFLSIGTVRNYLTSVVTKLNARSRLDAVRIASQSGWL